MRNKLIFNYILPFRKQFWLGTFFAFFGYTTWLAMPWLIGEVISFSARFQEGDATTYVWQCLAGIGTVALIYYCCIEIGRYTLYNVAERSATRLQREALSHITELDYAWHEKESSGSKLKKIGRGSSSLNRLIRMYMDISLDAVISLVGISIIFISMDIGLVLILLAFFIVHYVLSYFLTKRAVEQAEIVNKEYELFYGVKFEWLNQIRTVKSMDLGKSLLLRADGILERLLQALRLRILKFRTRLALLGLNQQLFRIIIVAFSVWMVIDGRFEVGIIAQVFFYFSKIEGAAQRFASMYHEWVMAKIDLEGLDEMLNTEPTIEYAGNIPFPKYWNSLHIQKLAFSYETKKVLKGIDLYVNKGERVGLVGASGAGKSTLFKLLLKLYDQYEGNISLDQISLKSVDRKDYLSHLGVVMQDTELFDGTIRENILIGQAEGAVDEERLRKVVQMAYVSEFADQLEEGLEATIGEKGIKLSGGEKQRIGIARAIYRQPDILLLDEATSHLDAHAEHYIQEALRSVFQQVTAIVIAHRLSTLKQMDRIYVLEDGEVLEEGSFNELLQHEQLFYSMWQQQQFA